MYLYIIYSLHVLSSVLHLVIDGFDSIQGLFMTH